MSPKISIILPVYNGERHLRESIESVLVQTFRDFEMVICDDGSTDDSLAIVRGYDDSRIKFHDNRQNRGLFANLNFGIKQAQGEYIRLWSQDDVMKTHCLETEMRYLALSRDAVLAYCAYDLIDGDGILVSKRAEISESYIVPPNIASEIMFYHGDITGNIANIIMRRSVIERAGLFREDMQVSGDFEMLVRLASEYSFCEIHDPLIYLRCHKGQFSLQSGVFPLHMQENIEIFHTLIQRLSHVDQKYARNYHRYERYVRYFHYAVRSAITGEWHNAYAAYRQLQKCGLVRTALGYLYSANLRLYRPKPIYSPALVEYFRHARPKFDPRKTHGHYRVPLEC